MCVCVCVCVCAHAVMSLVAQSCLTLCDPMDCSLPGSSIHGDSPSKNTGTGCHTLFKGFFPSQGYEPWSPALQADSLPSAPPGGTVGSARHLDFIPGLRRFTWNRKPQATPVSLSGKFHGQRKPGRLE